MFTSLLHDHLQEIGRWGGYNQHLHLTRELLDDFYQCEARAVPFGEPSGAGHSGPLFGTFSRYEKDILEALHPFLLSYMRQRALLIKWMVAGSHASEASSRNPLPFVRSWLEAACEGGYPPVLSLSTSERARWFDSYVATYLERDLQLLASIESLADFRRLVEVAALRLGELVNQADLARDAGLSRPTARRYLNLLETSYQLRRLPAFAKTRTARVVKSPKLYWTDTGLAAHLAGLSSSEELAKAPRRGAFLENVLLCHLDVWVESVSPRPSIYSWRTNSGAEVDFVRERGRRVLPIEVKAAATVRVHDAAGLEKFFAHHRTAKVGIIVHTGDEAFALTSLVAAIPLQALL